MQTIGIQGETRSCAAPRIHVRPYLGIRIGAQATVDRRVHDPQTAVAVTVTMTVGAYGGVGRLFVLRVRCVWMFVEEMSGGIRKVTGRNADGAPRAVDRG